MIEKIILGPKGLQFIRSELSLGRDLSQEYFKQNLGQGYLFSYIPQGLEEYNLDLSESLEYKTGKRVSHILLNLIVNFISSYLLENKFSYVIFETFWSKGDPILQESAFQFSYILINESVNILLRTGSIPSEIEESIKYSQHYPLIIVLGKSMRVSNALANKILVSPSVLQEIIQMTDYLIVGAFDDEGYIVWGKNNL